MKGTLVVLRSIGHDGAKCHGRDEIGNVEHGRYPTAQKDESDSLDQCRFAGTRVIVQRRKDRSIRIVSEEREVAFREILPAAPPARSTAKTPRVTTAHKPAADHPWRKGLRLREPATHSEQ